MRHTHKTWLTLAIVVAALVSALALTGCAGIAWPEVLSGAIGPSIVPASGVEGSTTVERAWDFDGERVQLKVPVDQAVYAGAKAAEKTTLLIGSKRSGDWLEGHFRSFIEDEHQDAFFEALLAQLHAVRTRQGLDDDRYVELVTSMVQTMEYRIDPGNLAPKFPIEMYADGYGDCDDKVLLAAALLARDGYDVAILHFEPEKHMALGIRAPGLDYRETGYAYVEMTTPSIPGIPPEKLAGDIELTSRPGVVKVGEGTREFTSGAQVADIERRLNDLKAAEKKLAQQIATETGRLDKERAALDAAQAALDTHADPASAAAAVDRYNARVRALNARVAQANELVARHNALVEVERFVAQNPTDRPQISKRLQEAEL